MCNPLNVATPTPSPPSSPSPPPPTRGSISTETEMDLVVHYVRLTIGSQQRHFLAWAIPKSEMRVYPLTSPISPPSPGPLFSPISLKLSCTTDTTIFSQDDFDDVVVTEESGPWHRQALDRVKNTNSEEFETLLESEGISQCCQDCEIESVLKEIMAVAKLANDALST